MKSPIVYQRDCVMVDLEIDSNSLDCFINEHWAYNYGEKTAIDEDTPLKKKTAVKSAIIRTVSWAKYCWRNEIVKFVIKFQFYE